jgi:undecaprenyl-diphosphatase
MAIWQAFLLGIVQGITEFLPVSSSAHLVLFPWVLGWQIDSGPRFAFDVLVQMGTLLAVIIYFYDDLWEITQHTLVGLWQRQPLATPQARLGWLLVLATIPAVVLGLLIKDPLENLFGQPVWVAGLLLITATLLVVAERLKRQQAATQLTQVTAWDALVIGLFQAFALLPGVSRSGSTITGGLMRGLDRRTAARFSFLMSVPVMLGAGVIGLKDLLETPNFQQYTGAIAVGFVVSAVVGWLTIHWLLGFLQRHSLYVFAAYCVAVALLGLGLAAWRAQNNATQPADASNNLIPALSIGVTPLSQPYALEWAQNAPQASQLAVIPFSTPNELLAALQRREVATALTLQATAGLQAFALRNIAVVVVSHPAESFSDWHAVHAALSTPNSLWQPFALPNDSELQAQINAQLLAGSPTRADTRLVFSEAELLAQIAKTPHSFGMVRADALLTPANSLSALSLPLLALTVAEPQGALRDWLNWIQANG